MEKVYVIMKTSMWHKNERSGLPHSVFNIRKNAKEECERLNKAAITNYYWVEQADLGRE